MHFMNNLFLKNAANAPESLRFMPKKSQVKQNQYDVCVHKNTPKE